MQLITKATTWLVAFVFLPCIAWSQAKDSPKPEKKSENKSDSSVESYQDLIQKAQNLTLQRDRLQAAQVLVRGIQRESKNSPAQKELLRTLDELTTLFYTEKAQSLFAIGEALTDAKGRESSEQVSKLQEAQRLEEGNLTIMKSLARAHLRNNQCERAEAIAKSAKTLNPFSAEVRLIDLQVLACQKDHETLSTRLAARDPDLESVEGFLRGLQVQDVIRSKDYKKAKTLLGNWETQAADYPELHYWKWQLSKAMGSPDRAAAVRYAQICQNLTPRRRKSYNLDVELCKGREAVDAYLKESGLQGSQPSTTSPGESAR